MPPGLTKRTLSKKLVFGNLRAVKAFSIVEFTFRKLILPQLFCVLKMNIYLITSLNDFSSRNALAHYDSPNRGFPVRFVTICRFPFICPFFFHLCFSFIDVFHYDKKMMPTSVYKFIIL